MRFVHGVIQRNIPFGFHLFGMDGVRFIRSFGFQWGKGDPAAGVSAFAHGPDYITAHRADVKQAAG